MLLLLGLLRFWRVFQKTVKTINYRSGPRELSQEKPAGGFIELCMQLCWDCTVRTWEFPFFFTDCVSSVWRNAFPLLRHDGGPRSHPARCRFHAWICTSAKCFCSPVIQNLANDILGENRHFGRVMACRSAHCCFCFRLRVFPAQHRPSKLRKTYNRSHFCFEVHVEV